MAFLLRHEEAAVFGQLPPLLTALLDALAAPSEPVLLQVGRFLAFFFAAVGCAVDVDPAALTVLIWHCRPQPVCCVPWFALPC